MRSAARCRCTSSHDNARFASCGGERLVYLWDVTTGVTIRRFQGHFQVRPSARTIGATAGPAFFCTRARTRTV